MASQTKLNIKDKRWSLHGMTALVTGGSRGIGLMVNNAGKDLGKKIMDHTAEDISTVMGTNFESAYHLTQLAHPLLKESGNGSIVFISSIAGGNAISSLSAYSASKGAMNQFTKNVALEWAKDNIRANAVAPGPVTTELLKSFLKLDPSRKNINIFLMFHLITSAFVVVKNNKEVKLFSIMNTKQGMHQNGLRNSD
ncbi:hypothetical protein Fmac_011012 [Flemingia macrophylla]|uniref:Uncharacterized protein n=1 Tax=Flemingia macrophylla TaxID=520843 RepID=A0ABD1ML81_9FABA